MKADKRIADPQVVQYVLVNLWEQVLDALRVKDYVTAFKIMDKMRGLYEEHMAHVKGDKS